MMRATAKNLPRLRDLQMLLPEAESLITQLLKNWLRSKQR